MKKLYLLLLFLTSAFICWGQDLNSDWEKVVDYVCSRYVRSYCDQRCKEKDMPQKDVDTYYTRIRGFLTEAPIGRALNRNDINHALNSNGFTRAYNRVELPLLSKYEVDESSRSISTAIDLSGLEDEVKGMLYATRDSLERELTEYFSPVKNDTSSSGPSTKASPSQRNSSLSFWKLVSILELLLIIVLFAMLFFRTSGERIKDLVYNSGRLEEKFASKFDVNADNLSRRELNNRVNTLEAEVRNLKQNAQKGLVRPTPPPPEYRNTKPSSSVVNNAPIVPPHPVFDPVYVKNFGDGLLRVVDLPEAQFKLELKNDSSASFSFCGDVLKALANSDGTFDFVCDQEGSVSDAKDILTTSPGLAIKQADGKWKVTSRAKIKFV